MKSFCSPILLWPPLLDCSSFLTEIIVGEICSHLTYSLFWESITCCKVLDKAVYDLKVLNYGFFLAQYTSRVNLRFAQSFSFFVTHLSANISAGECKLPELVWAWNAGTVNIRPVTVTGPLGSVCMLHALSHSPLTLSAELSCSFICGGTPGQKPLNRHSVHTSA